jgi:hypothetical protein
MFSFFTGVPRCILFCMTIQVLETYWYDNILYCYPFFNFFFLMELLFQLCGCVCKCAHGSCCAHCWWSLRSSRRLLQPPLRKYVSVWAACCCTRIIQDVCLLAGTRLTSHNCACGYMFAAFLLMFAACLLV